MAEMGNNLWPRKYPAFAKLEAIKQKQFWSVIFTAYAAMYASASQAATTEEDEERPAGAPGPFYVYSEDCTIVLVRSRWRNSNT